MGRRTELLEAAADALEDGRDPLTQSFLAEHDVTMEECHALAEQMAIGARLVACGLDNPRTTEGQAVMMALVRGLR